jgi:hypothetical protein
LYRYWLWMQEVQVVEELQVRQLLQEVQIPVVELEVK